MMNGFYANSLIPVMREVNVAFTRKGPDGKDVPWAAEYVFLQLKKGIFDFQK